MQSKAIDMRKVKKAHFIGIGGIGISAVARMMLQEGKAVSGSDAAESEITRELAKLGARIFIGQKAENISRKTDLIVYTIAISKDNLEFVEALRSRIPMKSYPEMLEEISRGKFTVAVSGTHGKTTTTAMIAKVLIDAKLDPTVIVGSFLLDGGQGSTLDRGKGRTFKTNFISGKSKYFVVEACEYRRSFLHIQPTILVITNIDNDHLDYYKDMLDIQRAFAELVSKVPKNGYVVTNATDRAIRPAIKNAKCKIVDYCEFHSKNLKLKVPGSHNRENAAASLAVAHILEIEKKKAAKSLEEFLGTWRRFELKGKTKNGALIYDDYGHHPTEIHATLSGARELYPKRKITVIFQPHLYSRTKLLLNEFAKAFSFANRVILAPIYAAREPVDSTISSDILAKKIEEHRGEAVSLPSFEAIEENVLKTLKKGEIVITMGAGDVYKIADELVDAKSKN